MVVQWLRAVFLEPAHSGVRQGLTSIVSPHRPCTCVVLAAGTRRM
ncbi:hypothetical protein Zm00014a_022360 [Zea mays]|uniref:Uncharacterized protein n=1 Tax=Zea mays TaxID=4577 RepID=A0A3L6FWX2_MAIZE|nr:hypothetical protein Zm00014a_022360 [Zea mays]